MKDHRKIKISENMNNLYYFLPFYAILLFGCSNYEITTRLNEDGTIYRSIIYESKKDRPPMASIFGDLDEKWFYEFLPLDSLRASPSRIKLHRQFGSIEEMNAIMNHDVDTLWQIDSELNSTFKWFFTYHQFSDQYSAFDRLRFVDYNDFFTEEDHHFIDRIQYGELTKADSLYLEVLEGRITEQYVVQSYKFELRAALKYLFTERTIPNWIDSIGKILDKLEIVETDLEDDLMATLLHDFSLPLDSSVVSNSITTHMKDFSDRLGFMENISSIRLEHIIELPGMIISSNAHFTNHNMATWKPRSITYFFKPLRMYATYFTVNWWAVALSVLFVLMTIYAFLKIKLNKKRGLN